ncbi:YbjN domain-containing protein [Jiangella alba]|uniref:Putative sensory transduction regulator n=1 Tax=Jiangella alba TaxID=561176 RepID=A0A1H5PMB8_9ACTN|nr:YbjN domain-containing protein [Jiangella alba]SEF14905.1 Putative sensory transduction regulator [Jiangella alba]
MSQLDRLRAGMPATPETARGPRVSHPDARGRRSDGDELIIEVLAKLGADHVADGDEISGIWENGLFFFGTLGGAQAGEDVFHIRGVWERAVHVDELSKGLMFANDWNAEHVWPKVFVQQDETDLLFHGETTADLGADPSFELVEKLITTAVSAALEVFHVAERAFPNAHLIAESPPGWRD